MPDHPGSHNSHPRGSEQGKEPSFGTESTVPGPKKSSGPEGNSDNKLRTAEQAMDKEVLLGNE